MIPGPVPMRPEVMKEAAKIMGHRTPEYSEIGRNISKNAAKVFGTKSDVYTLTSSGSGGIEAAVFNLVGPGDKVLCCSVGKFGDRAYKMAKAIGANATHLKPDAGKALKPQEVKKALKESGADVVTITHNETSTAVLNPIGGIAEEVGDEAVIIVDAVSSMGAVEYQHDAWNIGITLTGSQKALGVPPGVALIAVRPDLWERIEACKTPRFYFDLRKYRKKFEQNGQTPFTPATSLCMAMNLSLELMLKEGLGKIYARQKLFGDTVRAAVKEMGMELLAEEGYRSNMLTAVKAPKGTDVEAMRKIMKEKHKVLIAGGQEELKGKIFRIAHMGNIGQPEIVRTFEALHASLREVGFDSPDPAPKIREMMK